MRVRFTDKVVKNIPIQTASKIHYDEGGPTGFGVRVTPNGARTYGVRYGDRFYKIGGSKDWPSAAARLEAAEMRRRIDRGEDPQGERNAERNAPTMHDLAKRVIDEHFPLLRPRTAKGYRDFIEDEILPAIGDMKVAAVTFDHTSKMHRSITARGAPVHANRLLSALSKMFSYSIRLGWRQDNPCLFVTRNAERPRERYMSEIELPALVDALAALKDQQAANVVRILLLTGCRYGEALGARWDQFDLTTGVWTKPSSSTKQKRQHRVPLSEAAIAVLRGIRAEAPIGSFVFPAARGGGHRSEVRRAWGQVCKAAGIEGLRLHDVRHSYASMLVNSGLSLPVIGRLLGHSVPSTTARYAHLADDPLRSATERVGRLVTDAAGRGANVVPLRK